MSKRSYKGPVLALVLSTTLLLTLLVSKNILVSIESKKQQDKNDQIANENKEEKDITEELRIRVNDVADHSTIQNVENLYALNNNSIDPVKYPSFVSFSDSYIYLNKDINHESMLLEPTTASCTGYSGQVITEAPRVKFPNRYGDWLIVVLTKDNGVDGILAIDMITNDSLVIDRRNDKDIKNEILSMVVYQGNIFYTVENENTLYQISLSTMDYKKHNIKEPSHIININKGEAKLQQSRSVVNYDLVNEVETELFKIIPYLTNFVQYDIIDDVYYLIEYNEKENHLYKIDGENKEELKSGDIKDMFLSKEGMVIVMGDQTIYKMNKDKTFEKQSHKVDSKSYGFVVYDSDINITKINTPPIKLK